ncbi:MAG: hypothetical protein FD133_1177 [Erysipelotrichaceae bacterium]|nr:MAG: hypothetical protein FD179_1596 [Erysipelotrichaceae bacterium]TXT17893.1 MAG: hypothetical protein FD133_1177 [Erysipelotrichaceae bacterium]
MIKTDRMNYLLDFYKDLLTDHQKSIAELHFYEDLSLSEITDHTQNSRAAVHETLKRVESLLEEYESKLHLVDKYLKRKICLDELRALKNEQVSHIAQAIDDLDQKEPQ